MTELNDTQIPDNEAPRGRKRMVAGVLIVLAAIGGTISYYHFRDRINTDDAQVDGHLVPVSAKVYGSVEKVLVEDNQAVHAGDLLVQIDARDLQSKVDQAVAALDQAQAQVLGSSADDDKAKLSYEQGKGSEVQVAEATLDARKATMDRTKADLERMKPLAARQEISALQFDGYRTAAEVAESEYRAGQRRLSSTRQESEIRRSALGSQQARVAQARAGVEAAKAHLAALKLELSYTRITAAVDGVVTRKTVETGQIIQPGQGLLTLVPLHQTWVTANFKETQLTKVRPGQPAEVEVDMNGQMLHGTVDSVAGSTGSRMSLLPPENAVGNFVKVVQRIPVKILLDPADAQKVVLRPGMNVDVTILTK